MHLHGLGGHEGDHLHDNMVGAALSECPQALCYGASCSDIHANVLHTAHATPLQHFDQNDAVRALFNHIFRAGASC